MARRSREHDRYILGVGIDHGIRDRDLRVDVIRRPDEDELEELTQFVDHVAATTGKRPLSDHLWLDLRSGGSDGFVAVRLRDDDHTVALAQISAGNDSSSLETVIEPGRVGDVEVKAQIAHRVMHAFQEMGGGQLFWWLDDPEPELRQIAAHCGLRPVRQLHEMRVDLPHPESASIRTRAFVPGRDDAAWLEVNNLAFASHAEQGGWTQELLDARLAEDWFDPEGFRLYDPDGQLLGFCWTKLHLDADPVAGEIYVVAVHPDAHGRGLGRELTLAGLDAIASRGIELGLLYVDEHNDAAIRLYEQLGFTTHHVRTAFRGHLLPMLR